MRIAYFAQPGIACDEIRIRQPLEALAKSDPSYEVRGIDRFKDPGYIRDSLGGDVVVFARVIEPKTLEIMRVLKANGKKIVLDHDDDLFHVNPFSSSYDACGIEDVYIELDGKKTPLWVDGKTKGFDIKTNKKRHEFAKRALEMADLTTVTSPVLKELFSQYTDRIAVLPNCIDSKLWCGNEQTHHSDHVRMYWSGGSSHYEDWTLIADALPVVMKKYSNLKLVIMGHRFEGTLKGCPQDRLEFHDWAHIEAFPYKQRLIFPDFGVIPLADNQFNRCKSAIKFLELSAMGVPSVMSHVTPYKEMEDGDNGIWVEKNTKSGWVDAISIMVEDIALRKRMGQEAKSFVLNNYDIQTQVWRWGEAYTHMCESKEAVKDGNTLINA